MKNINHLLKTYLKTLLIIIVATFILTILNYTKIINKQILSLLEIILIIITTLISGKKAVKNVKSKGWLEGIKLSTIIIITFLIINLLIIKKLDFSNLIYYLIILTSTTFGSMIGINKN